MISLSQDKLLNETMCTLMTKTINRICVSGDISIELKRNHGLNMTIESSDLFFCRIEGTALHIETCSTYKWYCCIPIKSFSKNNKSLCSDNWTINSVFIVKSVEHNGNGNFIMNEGFDKSLSCEKTGSGLMSIANLNVVDFHCMLKGNGCIETIKSSCSYFNGEIVGNGKIKTPIVSMMFRCRINGKGMIEGIKSKKCDTDIDISKNGVIKMLDIYEV